MHVLHYQNKASEIFIQCTRCILLALPWAKCHPHENKCSASPLHFIAECMYNDYFYLGFYLVSSVLKLSSSVLAS